MSFKKNKYAVIKQAISKDLAAFIANYFYMQNKFMIPVEKQNTYRLLKLC